MPLPRKLLLCKYTAIQKRLDTLKKAGTTLQRTGYSRINGSGGVSYGRILSGPGRSIDLGTSRKREGAMSLARNDR